MPPCSTVGPSWLLKVMNFWSQDKLIQSENKLSRWTKAIVKYRTSCNTETLLIRIIKSVTMVQKTCALSSIFLLHPLFKRVKAFGAECHTINCHTLETNMWRSYELMSAHTALFPYCTIISPKTFVRSLALPGKNIQNNTYIFIKSWLSHHCQLMATLLGLIWLWCAQNQGMGARW